MITAPTLFRYISRHFLLNVGAILLMLLGLVYVLDTIELLRRAAGRDVGFVTVLAMAAMKLPQVGQQIIPFSILFGAIYTCWKLNRTHELVVIRSAGISAWQFLAPMMFSALMLGVIATGVVNPVSSMLLAKYEQMEIIHLQKNDNLVTVSRTGIWLRQPTDSGYALFHAENFNQDEWRFSNLVIYFFDRQDGFLSRIDSPVAYLGDGHWDIRQAIVNDRDGAAHYETRQLPTELTSRKIEESFADPETISFWKMPEHLNIMEETGLPIASLEIHFQSLLAEPFLLMAMVLLAATFSLRPPRFGGTGMLIALGVAAGFFIFFMESILHAFGVSQKIPVYLAAWTPAIVSLLLGTAALLHMEDG
jgi:lipopolysaccharide export system permease protein